MSKTTSVVAGLVVLSGLVLLAAVPIGGLLLLYLRLGLPALTLLMFGEAAIGFARNLSPLRGSAWWKRTDDVETPRFLRKVLGLELALSAFAVALIAFSAPWWRPYAGIHVPLWLLVLFGLRAAINSTVLRVGLMRRPLAGTVGLFDALVVVPLFVLITGSVGGALVGATLLSFVLLLFVTGLPTKDAFEKATGKKLTEEKDERDSPDRWLLGSYLNSVAGYLRRPLLVAVAGAAALVPYSAGVMLASLLALPFLAVAVHRQLPKSRVLRVTVATVLAGVAFLVIRDLGPAIYRAIYPASFGNGAWLELFAWGAFSVIPASLHSDKQEASGQLRLAISGIVYGALLIVLTITHGLSGLLLAASLGLTVSTLVGVRCKRGDALISE